MVTDAEPDLVIYGDEEEPTPPGSVRECAVCNLEVASEVASQASQTSHVSARDLRAVLTASTRSG